MAVNTVKRGNESATIDVNLVTLVPDGGTEELIIETSSKIAVTADTETVDATKLVIRGVLKAQKPAETTVTGHTIVMTDNVFIPELVLILQGGAIKYASEPPESTEIVGYTPPVAGSKERGKKFTLNCYSAEYNAAGDITRYEKISYPNCKGAPVALNSENDVFRAPEYTITSAPNQGQPPYDLDYVPVETFEALVASAV